MRQRFATRNNLLPFAMHRAFPGSDYYESSATEMVRWPNRLSPVAHIGLRISASPVKNVVLDHRPLDSVAYNTPIRKLRLLRFGG